MNAVHGRDEINPFASSSRGTYAELAIEEPAPVIAHPRRFAVAGVAYRTEFEISDAANRVRSHRAMPVIAASSDESS
jgi:hypothetical protein